LSFSGDLYPTAGATSVMSTKGDMVDYNTARQRLAIGSANQILQVKSNLPSWETVDLADTVLTTAGDVLYENATPELARLGAGTQYFNLQMGASLPAWSASSSSVLTASGDVLYASSANTLAKLAKASDGDTLQLASGVPAWVTVASGSTLTKVTKSYTDIVEGTLSMPIYTLPADQALTNVFTDITTVFDISTAVTIGDSGDDNGFQEATNWTSGTGLTSATRGAYVTNWKGMRSTSGTTAITANNFTAGGSSMGSVADGTIFGADFDETTPNPFSTGYLDFVRIDSSSGDYCTANGAHDAMSTKGTISVWFKVNEFEAEDNDDRVWEFGDTNLGNWFSVAFNSPLEKFEITNRSDWSEDGNTAWTGETPNYSLTADEWYHLIITHNETEPTFWLGKLGVTMTDQTTFAGVQHDLSVWVYPTYIDNFTIGRADHSSTTNNYLNGSVAELAMWDEVLSDAEIQILHGATAGDPSALPQPADTYSTDLRVWFTFNPEDSMTNDAPITLDSQGAVDFYLQIAKE